MTLYLNPAIAAAAILYDPSGRVLVVRRAREPALGQLAFPGGFIDVGETAEQALRREILEEIGIEAGPLEYLTSHPNLYLYREVEYPVLDFLFAAKVSSDVAPRTSCEVTEFLWCSAGELDPTSLAFPSLVAGWTAFLQRHPIPPSVP